MSSQGSFSGKDGGLSAEVGDMRVDAKGDRKKQPESRNSGGLQKLEMARKWIFSRSLHKEHSHDDTLIFKTCDFQKCK